MASIVKNINWSDPFMKALKAVNSISNGATELTIEDLEKQRASMERLSKVATIPLGIETEQFTHGNLQCEWVRPDFAYNKDTIILYAHGGGYTCGGLSYARILAAKMAINCGLSVLTFEYGLAPENKYPKALIDGMTMWDYLLYKGYGAKNIILAGDSAGGNLVLCMTQKIIAKGRIAPKALLLYSPWTDMTATAPSYEKCKDIDPILTYNYVTSVRDAYIGKNADPMDSKYSPLYGEFNGFPPTLVQVGKNEILLDDSSNLVKKMQKSGVNARIQIFEGGWHVFQQMPVPIAGKAMTDLGEYVRALLYNN